MNPQITGVVLAGGRGSRMGEQDKGLMPLAGRPMIAAVLERFAPQVDEVLISANRNLEIYASFGYRVMVDEVSGYAGPLAGLECAMTHARHTLIASVPCDTPFLPRDLVARLLRARREVGAQVAVAKTGARTHPVFCLTSRDLRAHLRAFLDRGERKMDAWYATLQHVEVAFDDDAAAFLNINSPEDLSRVARGPRRMDHE